MEPVPAPAEAKWLEQTIGAKWIIAGLIGTTFYGYEAMGFSTDPESCYASDNSNFRVTNLKD